MAKIGMRKDKARKRSINHVKPRKADKLFTEYMRLKFNYTCQLCGRKYNPEDTRSLMNLGVSHYWSRRREATRFDVENCDLFCNLPCHNRLEYDKNGEYKEFMVKKLGQRGYDLLEVRAHTTQKKEDEIMELWLKQEIDKLKEKTIK